MEPIHEDIAKNIWGFFLDSDCDGVDDDNDYSRARTTMIDLASICSLRSVNRFFRKTFDDYHGWSRCAIAMCREYAYLENEASRSWNLRVSTAKLLSQMMDQGLEQKNRKKRLRTLLEKGPFATAAQRPHAKHRMVDLGIS